VLAYTDVDLSIDLAALLPLIAPLVSGHSDVAIFDTELLVPAERGGLRIHEVPVDWHDDPDSRVDIGSTVRADLRGVWRLLRFRDGTGPEAPLPANALALLLTAVANTAANRRLTFGVRGDGGLAGDHVVGLLAFGAGLLVTSGALAVLHAVDRAAGRWTELSVLVAASGFATVLRFAALRSRIAPGVRPAC
jgi:hypothetical protein